MRFVEVSSGRDTYLQHMAAEEVFWFVARISIYMDRTNLARDLCSSDLFLFTIYLPGIGNKHPSISIPFDSWERHPYIRRALEGVAHYTQKPNQHNLVSMALSQASEYLMGSLTIPSLAAPLRARVRALKLGWLHLHAHSTMWHRRHRFRHRRVKKQHLEGSPICRARSSPLEGIHTERHLARIKLRGLEAR